MKDDFTEVRHPAARVRGEMRPVTQKLFCERPDGFCDCLLDELKRSFGKRRFQRLCEHSRLLQLPVAELKRKLPHGPVPQSWWKPFLTLQAQQRRLSPGEGLLCSSQGLLKEDAQAMQIAGVRLLEFFSIARSYSRGGQGLIAPQKGPAMSRMNVAVNAALNSARHDTGRCGGRSFQGSCDQRAGWSEVDDHTWAVVCGGTFRMMMHRPSTVAETDPIQPLLWQCEGVSFRIERVPQQHEAPVPSQREAHNAHSNETDIEDVTVESEEGSFFIGDFRKQSHHMRK
eukprot:g11928.t1